ncbi:MAG: MATE family efflux transporter [Ruminococcus sp.]|nr:MATE family efflux transporter [Ruminococcus sp.]MCM1380705.1 MATE family efflux transporter [Muribaculaceae bacterium]MCM1480813.1 MATE family efflux transporter [Muribaculaceae bacterium]
MLERKSTVINRQFNKFFFPTIFMSMAMSMSIVVDGMIVGKLLGPEGLAAVNLVLPVTLGINAVCALFGMGGAALFSIALGRRDKERSKQLFTAAVAAMAAASLAVAAAGLFASRSLAELLTKKAPDLTDMVYGYMGIILLGAPLLIIVPGTGYFIRASGKVNLASAAIIAANVINLALDIVYIKFCGMGIKGAAYSTVTGYAAGLVISVIGVVQCENLRFCGIPFGKLGGILGETVSTGLSNAVSNVLNFFRMICINAIVMNYLGSAGVTALSVCTSCLSVVSMFIAGSAQTMVPILGTLYGEGDFKGVRFAVHRSAAITGISSLAMLFLFQLFPAQIAGFYGVEEAAQLSLTINALRIYTVSLPVLAMIFAAKYVYPVTGFKRLSSVLALLEGFCIVVPAAWILPKLFGGEYVWFAFTVSEFLCLIFLLAAAKIISKKRGDVSGLFLLTKETDKNVLDVTMIREEAEAVKLSEEAIEFCRRNGFSESAANRAGVALEDMTVNIIQQKNDRRKNGCIDVRIRIDEKFAYICIRDSGAPYNPLLRENAEDNFDNIGVVLAMAKETSYDNILGMNSSIIKIAR